MARCLEEGRSGWVFARAALEAVHAEAERLGIKFVAGSLKEKVEALLYSDDGSTILGTRTADRVEHTVDRTILAAGANSGFLFDFERQLRPTAWTLAHIPLTPGEARVYKDLPVLFNVERGFFIELDASNHEMKICDKHPGYCNFVRVDGELRSVPFARQRCHLKQSSACGGYYVKPCWRWKGVSSVSRGSAGMPIR